MQTISEELQIYEQNINKSKFIAYACYTNSVDSANKIILDISKKNADAKHIVFAYVIEPNIVKKENSTEPTNTAGTPILTAIQKKKLTNTLVVVVRYFGGVLLGTGGLYRAYSTSAVNVLEQCTIRDIRKFYKFSVKLDYSQLSQIEKIDPQKILIFDKQYGESVGLILAVETLEVVDFLSKEIELQQPSVEEIWV